MRTLAMILIRCPFYPRKRTNSRHLRRSALCQKRTLARLFDHVVGAGEKRFRDGQSDRRCGLEVYDQLEFGRQLNRQLRGFAPFKMRSIYIAARRNRSAVLLPNDTKPQLSAK